ncbi:MAG: hypothetical protein FK731_14255 [Asgard group archaeon]|nr:hypothetical protein [Asgard group archaeon]
MAWYIPLYGILILFSSIILIISAFLTIPLFKKTHEESFFHMTLTLFLFSIFLLIISLCTIFLPEKTTEAFQGLEIMQLTPMIRFYAILLNFTIFELTIFYLTLCSNRIHIIERYFPLIPAFFLGWVTASLIVSNTIFDALLFYNLYIILLSVLLLVLIMLIRLRNVRDKFKTAKYEQKLLTHLIIMLLGYFIYQAADLVSLIGILFSMNLFTINTIIQFALLPILSILLLLQSRSIWKIVDSVNFPLLLNELS